MDEPNPCLTCGACCAAFRVSFYWAEAEEYGLPEPLYERLTPVLAAMRGTNQPKPRCAALVGEVGAATHCAAYEGRPSPCRMVTPGDDKCVRARAINGLAPL